MKTMLNISKLKNGTIVQTGLQEASTGRLSRAYRVRSWTRLNSGKKKGARPETIDQPSPKKKRNDDATRSEKQQRCHAGKLQRFVKMMPLWVIQKFPVG